MASVPGLSVGGVRSLEYARLRRVPSIVVLAENMTGSNVFAVRLTIFYFVLVTWSLLIGGVHFLRNIPAHNLEHLNDSV